MPTGKDVVPNRPLAGHELKQIMQKDFDSMLNGDGMFSAHMGFRRVAYEISIKLHLDNPMHPEHKNKRVSKDPAKNEVPPKSDIKAYPLQDPNDDTVATGVTRTRQIESPNAARIEFELPVETQHMDRQTGEIKSKPVVYDKVGVTPTKVNDKDISSAAQQDWGK